MAKPSVMITYRIRGEEVNKFRLVATDTACARIGLPLDTVPIKVCCFCSSSILNCLLDRTYPIFNLLPCPRRGPMSYQTDPARGGIL